MNSKKLCAVILVLSVATPIIKAAEAEKEPGYLTVDLATRSRSASTVRSVLIPGWGQAYNRQRVKGMVLFGTVAASLAGSAILYNASRDSYHDYEAAGYANGSLYDDYERERTQAMILGSVGVGLWIFSIIDAYRNSYKPLWTKNQTWEVALAPHESRVLWKKWF